MMDCFAMWRRTRMVTLTAVCAAIYAAVLIPTQVFPLIPGSTNLRPGSAIAIVLSLLFGPAGAWGVAFGNTLNDLFGTFGPGTWFGFFGNFLLGLIPYKLWTAWNGGPLPPAGGRGWLVFVPAVIIASAACALVIGWGLHILGFVPFAALGPIIFLNNSLFGLVLGPPLLAALAPRVRAWGITYDELLDESEKTPGVLARPASVLVAAAALGGLALGVYLSAGVHGQALFRAEPRVAGVRSIGLGLFPIIAVLVLATMLL